MMRLADIAALTLVEYDRLSDGDSEITFHQLPKEVQRRVFRGEDRFQPTKHPVKTYYKFMVHDEPKPPENPLDDIIDKFGDYRLAGPSHYVGGSKAAFFYVVQYTDGLELFFWPNGDEVQWEEEEPLAQIL